MSLIPTTQNTNRAIREYDLTPDGDYPARIVRFIGLGTQDQPPYQGQVKQPAFKAAFMFELIGMDTSGTETKDGVTTPLEPQPACTFADMYLFPGASRGKVFDLVNTIDPSLEKVPADLDWFEENMDSIVNVKIGSYIVKNGPNAGKRRNTVEAVSAVPTMFKSQVGESRSEKVFFDPYVDNEAMFAAYSKLYKFQRDMLVEAKDVEHIPYAGKEPAINGATEQNNIEPDTQNNVPVSKASDAADDDAPF